MTGDAGARALLVVDIDVDAEREDEFNRVAIQAAWKRLDRTVWVEVTKP